jgi:hypothetical protein
MGDEDVHRSPNQLGSKFGRAVASTQGVAELNRDIPAFRIAKSMQTLLEGIGEGKWG